MVKKVLVTTALEETWPEDGQSVVFLGEWCRLYSRHEQWSRLNADVVVYHWDDREKLFKDFKVILEIYERILEDLSIMLNEFHSINKTTRYWRILIGTWLFNFLQILFDRWEMTKRAVQDQNDLETCVLNFQYESIIPNGMADFFNLFVSDEWNNYIYGQILKQFPHVNIINKKYVKFDTRIIGQTQVNTSLLGRISNVVRNIYRAAAKKSSKNQDVFFYSTFLTKADQFKLALKFKQIPLLSNAKEPGRICPEKIKREWVLKGGSKTVFEEFARKIIPQQIPVLYLEGYRSLVEDVREMHWPAHPKIIFTSNAHYGDDIFKLYTAEKVQIGVPLVIAQHGGHYGTSKWSSYEEHELAICSRYLSWGWVSEQNAKIKPVGKVTADKLVLGDNRKENALLVTMAMPRYSYTMYSSVVAGQWLKYFEDQCSFIEALSDAIRDKLIVRIYRTDYGWAQYQRFRDRFPELKIDKGQGGIREQIIKSRLYISTYNATTYLETFNMGVPTIIYWDPHHWELRDSAIPFYEDLKRVGVFHETPASAAAFVNTIWNDVDLWWNNSDLKTVVEGFKKQFCHLSGNLVGKIEAELRQEMDNNLEE